MTQSPESELSFFSVGMITHVFGRFISDFYHVPRWHKGILAASLLSLTIGWTHWGYRAMTDASSTATTQSSTNPSPTDTGTLQPTVFASWARRVGGSILTGFVIGWAFRAFLRTMAVVTTFVVGTLTLLSYFNIMNVDLTMAEKKYGDATTWVTDQAGKLRDSAMNHVHSTAGGALGVFMGIKKRRVPGAQLLSEG